MQKKKVIGFILMLIAILIISFGGRSTYAAGTPKIMERESGTYVTGKGEVFYAIGAKRAGKTKYTADLISSITLVTNKNVPANAEASWDISYTSGSNEVIAWVVQNSTDTTKYDLYIGSSSSNIEAPSNSHGLFRNYTNCVNINNLKILTTQNITDAGYMFFLCNALTSLDLQNFVTTNITQMNLMFSYCTSLVNLDLSSFNTSKVVNMRSMFDGSKNLTSLDLSNFDTRNVTDIAIMFYGCSNLESVKLSSFDTTKVTDMYRMFYSCGKLTNLDLSNFRTPNVTTMSNMFYYCTSLTSLNVSNFDTTKVTDMYRMFYSCGKLTSLDLSNFKTPNVTNMTEIFYYCSSLTSLDVSNFDTKNISDMSSMFSYCRNLTNLDLSNFRTPNVTTMSNMFYYCTSLTSLNVSNFDTTNVTSMEKMFNFCEKLTSLNLSNFKTPNVINMTDMFYYCQSLTSLDVSNFNTENILDMSRMFYYCRSLTGLDLSSFRTSKVTNMSDMFYNCRSLTSLNVSNFDTTNVTDMRNMFNQCHNLTSLNVSNFDTTNVTDMRNMFNQCHNLTSLNVSNFDTTNVTDMSNMFSECKSLTSLNLNSFNTTNVTNMGYMFFECTNLKALELENFSTSKVTDMSAMFYDCKNLESLNVSGFDTSNVTNMEGMFYGCHSLGSLDLSGFNTSNVTNMQGMFYECKKIKHLNLSGFNTSKTTNMQGLFYDCSEIISLDISNFDTSKVTNMAYMFYNCSNLKSIILDKEITSSDQAMKLLTNTLLNMLPNAILYVPNEASEKFYEAATNYSSLFADSKDANGDLYRIRPILEIAGENPAKIVSGGTYDATNDAGVKIAGFDKTNEDVYTQYGYNYTTSGLPVDTTSTGTKQVTYTITKTKDGTTTNGMTATRDVKVVGVPKLMEREISDNVNGNMVYYVIGAKRSGNTKYTADLISTITFVNNTNIPTTAEANWDVSYTSGDGDVIAWVIPSGDMYNLCIGTKNETIQAPTNLYNLFGRYTNCTVINNLKMLDTTNVTSMNSMFYGCSSLTSLDLTNFNTSKVINMSNMFKGCSKIKSLDLSDFDTSNVTGNYSLDGMNQMFYDCSSLTSLDISSFDTSKVPSMSGMFANCRNLINLDVSGFDTKNVMYMGQMFYNCTSLTTLDVSNFDTSKVTYMRSMFWGCSNLKSLDVSNFDTSNVRSMAYMFNDCSQLTILDLSEFDTSNVKDMNKMFSDCRKLKILILGKNFNKLGEGIFGKYREGLLCNLASIIAQSSTPMTLSSEVEINKNFFSGAVPLTPTILYVPSVEAETEYEAAENYSTVFGADKVRPILELIGANNINVAINDNYVDDGITIAGFGTAAELDIIKQHGYSVGVENDVIADTIGTYTVKYTLYYKNPNVADSVTEEVMSVTRTVNVIEPVVELTIQGNSVNYALFEEAMAAANLDENVIAGKEAVIKLLQNCTMASSAFIEGMNKRITLDLNGYKLDANNITSKNVIEYKSKTMDAGRSSELTIVDNSASKTGYIERTVEAGNNYIVEYGISVSFGMNDGIVNKSGPKINTIGFVFGEFNGFYDGQIIAKKDSIYVQHIPQGYNVDKETSGDISTYTLVEDTTSPTLSLEVVYNTTDGRDDLANAKDELSLLIKVKDDYFISDYGVYSELVNDFSFKVNGTEIIPKILNIQTYFVDDNTTKLEIILTNVTGDGVLSIEVPEGLAYDMAQNTNAQTTLTSTITIDNTAPTDTSAVINNGKKYTNNNTVTVDLNAIGALFVKLKQGKAGGYQYRTFVTPATASEPNGIRVGVPNGFEIATLDSTTGAVNGIIKEENYSTITSEMVKAGLVIVKVDYDSNNNIVYGDEFVWVPTTIDGVEFGSPTTDKSTDEEKEEVKKAVEKYGGFYIARYEASGLKYGSGTVSFNFGRNALIASASANDLRYASAPAVVTGTARSVRNAIPSIGIPFDVMKDATINIYPGLSQMMGPYSYRATLQFMESQGINVVNASGWGNTDVLNEDISIPDGLIPTGSNEKYKALNIYDLSGNAYEVLDEWTEQSKNKIKKAQLENLRFASVTDSIRFAANVGPSILYTVQGNTLDASTTSLYTTSQTYYVDETMSFRTVLYLVDEVTDDDWLDYSENSKVSYTFDSSDGLKVINAWFKDDAGNITEIVLGEIIVDTVKPIAKVAKVVGKTATLTLTDDVAGIDGYAVTTTNTEPNVSEFITVSPVVLSTTVTYTAANLGRYYVWAKDQAGNISLADVFDTKETILMERESSDYINSKYVYYAIGAKRSGNKKYTADLISTITFVNNTNIPTTVEASWDASYTSGDGDVIAWVIPNAEDSTKYDLFIGAEGDKIQAPANSYFLFGKYTNCTAINNLTMLDTSKVTNMGSMFYYCSNLTNLDVSNFDTSKVTKMGSMFRSCSSLTELDVSNFNTTSVTDMNYMFCSCSSLTELNVSNFNTTSVTNMYAMFSSCSSLTELDVSNFNTTSVTIMSSMFGFCSSLTNLDVSNFNTTSVTNMSSMFYACSSLTELNVSKFDTSKVTNMRNMFGYCSSLTELDVSKFDTSKVTDITAMFYSCTKIVDLDVSKFDTSNVTAMGGMFGFCSSLTNLDVSKFDTSKVTNIGRMFYSCSSLTSLNVSNFNTTSVTDMNYMFSSCSSLTELNVSKFDTSKVTNMDSMFGSCSSLTELDVSKFDTSNVTDMSGMFNDCSNLTSLDVSKFDTSKVTDMNRMFSSCSNLKAIILDKEITSSDQAMKLQYSTMLEILPNAILYVSDAASEKLYEAATNYATIFADSRDTEGDLYRVRPILEVAGENPVKVKIGETYDATVDAGATIAGFEVTDSGEYTQYGYNYTTSGLPVDTTSVGTKQVTYTLTKTKDGTTTNGMTATRDIKVTEVPKLMERDYDTTNGYKYVNYALGAKRAGKTKYKKDLISTVTLVGNKNVPTTAEASWDVSYTNGSNEVIAWVIPNATDGTKYDLYIGADDTSIQAPANSVDLFSNYTNCTEINNLEMLDTSKVTSMMYMFHLCNNLTKVNVSNFDTSKVTTMYGMFGYCNKLTSLDVSKFNTSNVTNMFAMFGSCRSLTSLDVTSFDTSKVTSMLCMFTDCSSLTSLDLSNFNTSNVTDMKEMFRDCSSLKELDLSSFDTSKVTTMNAMFCNCSSLTNLNVSSFNTSKVTDMSLMFASCRSLPALDLSKFNTSNVTTFAAMFSTCSSLENLNLATFDTRNARTIGFMFYNCSSLTNVVVTGTNFRFTKLDHTTAGVTGTYESLDINCVFAKCSSLTGIDLSSWNITTSENMNELFADCTNLKSIVLGRNFAALKGADMFKNCDNLRAIITKRTTPLTLATGTGAETVGVNNPKVLYVETKQLESSFESASNYASVFGADRIRPILEVAGENPVKVKIGETYDATVDAGATIAGFGVADSGEYTQYGYNYTTVGLPVDTTTKGTKQVTYTLTKTENGTTTNGMTTTRTVNVVGLPKLMERESSVYIRGTGYVYYVIGAKRAEKTKYTADLISSITFVANKNVPSTAEASWDASYTNGDNEVIAWVMPNTTDSTKYDLYIGFDNTIIQAPKVSENLFREYTNCTIINNLTMLDTSNVTDMSYMFYNCSQLTSLDVSKFDTSKVINMSWMFYYCSNLTSLNLSSFNTSNVTTMHNMFAFCRNLTSLDVSKFDTSNVTNMASMFADCSKLTSLDVSKFDTSNVTNMSGMFYGCSKLTSLDVSKFDTSNVTIMSSMFNGCSNLTSLDVSKFNTSNVTNMNAMFESCRSLTSLDVTNFDTSKVTDLSIMFDSCRSLSALDVSSFDTSNVTNMSYMFYGCSNLTSLDVSSFDTSNVAFMRWMFGNCSNLTSLDVSNFNTTNVTTMESMFNGCSKLKAIILDKSITASSQAMKLSTGTSLENLPNAILYVPDTASEKLYEAATNYATTFADSRDANGDLYRIRPILEVAGENPVKVKIGETYDATVDAGATIAGFDKTNASEYTQYGYNYTTAGLPLNTSAIGTKQVTYTLTKTENGTTTNGMTATRTVNVVGLPKLMERETYTYIAGKGDTYYAIGAKRSGNTKYTADLISSITFVANKNVPTSAEASWDVSYTNGDNEVIAWVIQNATDNTKYDLYIGADDTKIQAPANSTNLFEGYENCTAINNLSMLDTSKVTKMVNMFSQCSSLISLDASSFDTSNVTNMFFMFSNCKALTILDVSGFDTSNVTNMLDMFFNCSSLTSLDVSTFDTSKVTDMSAMFSSCSSLTSLDLSNFNTSKVTDMNRMFSSCSSLTNVDLSGFNTSSATNMECMFALCSDLTSVDVSNFDTSKVTTMKGMFYLCSSLTSLDLSNFNTSKVTDMDRMFSSCSSLINLDLNSFDTSNVTNMSGMFSTCSSLTSLDLSSWNITASKNMNELFADCTNLKSIVLGRNFAALKGADMFKNCDNLRAIITKRTTPLTLATGTGAETVGVNNPKVLYVETKQLESSFESASNYASVFGADRIRPILGVAGENPAKVSLNGIYDETKDAGATIAGFTKAESSEYTQYGYNYTTAGLPLNTSAIGTKQVTYTLRKTENGTTTNGMTTTRTVNVVGLPKLMERDDTRYAIGAYRSSNPKYKANLINSITFVDNTDVPTTAEASWDASYTDGAGEVIAWIIPNADDSTKYDLYIGADDTKIQSPENSDYLFTYYTTCTTISNISMLDTSKVTSMHYMFFNCSSLTSLNLSNFDTSNVTNMSYMFYECSSLKSLNISNFDTSNVTNMSFMFFNCSSLTSLNLSNFDTSNVTDMTSMFNECSSLTSLDVSSFNTSNVTYMTSMFDECSSLTSLDVSNFDTSKVKSMGFMFGDCKSLTSLDVSNFDTSNVTQMSYIFYNCKALTSLDVSNFDTTKVTKVTNMNKMFNGCTSLKAIILDKKITSSDQAMKLLTGDDAVKTGLENLPNAILYVHDTESEKLYEAATNYSTVFADSRDANGDLYRIRPILEVAGDNPAKVSLNGIYDETKDAGATIAGFTKAESSEYTQYGYNYTTSGLPVDTTSVGTKQVTYTLTKTKNGTTTIGMTATRDVKVVDVPILMERESFDYINNQFVYYSIGAKRSGNKKYTADLISTITFINNTNIPTTAEASWDASYTSGDNEVIAWVIPNTTDSTKYDLFIGAEDVKIQSPVNSDGLFEEYTNCTVINNLTMLDTENATIMTHMFMKCYNLTSLDVSEFNTSNVKNMYYMFGYCHKIENLDINKFNTSNVTNMGSMFNKCYSLTNLDVSKFNTSSVTYMDSMFDNCSNLTSLNVGNFDTSKVTGMSWMFNGCSNLTSLDVSNFNTSRVTNMGSMFSHCRNLTSLDVSKFDTSKVTDMGNMFVGSSKLTSLDVSGFDTSKVKSMGNMFSRCTNLKNIDLRSFDTSSLDGKTYNMSGAALGVDVNSMFSYCGNLESIIIGDKFNRLDGYDMFRGCNKLKAIITTKTITASSDAPTLSGTENVTNSNGEIIAGPNGLKNLPNAILYVPDTTSEKLYEAATNYSTVFADSRDANGDLYRVHPILEVAGENPVKVKVGGTYDATVDAGATIAGFGVADSGEYTQYGYNYTTSGLPVDTTTKGTKQVTYTLTKTENGTTINGMTATRDVKVVEVPMLSGRESPDYINNKTVYYVIGAKRSGNTKYTADLISTITFVNNANIPSTAEASWDASYTSGDGDVIAWVIPNAEDSTKYDLFIGADDTRIQAPTNSTHLFGNYKNCIAINNLTMLDTSKIIIMDNMFANCGSLTSLDVSNFDTTNVTSMHRVFYYCGKLTSVDVSNFNTSNVTSMSQMFSSCGNLTSLDLKNFDTTKVTDMGYMFYYCGKLTSLDVSNFDTSKVTRMERMFYECRNLANLDVSNFNTSKVTDMGEMFFNCSSLTSLNVSNFDTTNVTDMSHMFHGCRKLTSLDVSNFDTSKVTDMSSMFYSCGNLVSLDVSNFNTTSVTDMDFMFSYCSKLLSLNVKNFDTSKVTSMEYMFTGCKALTSIDLSNFDTSKVTSMKEMFSSCNGLTSLNISNFDTSKVTNMNKMFNSCSSLKAIILDKEITSSDQAMKLLTGDDTVKTGLENLPNAILYVPDVASEKLYEAATNYSTTFADSRDANGDLYRIRPILEVAGENPVKVKIGETYDATVDAGATIAGFDKTNASEYTQYGYNYTTSGLPVDTTTKGTKQVTYTLTKTENGTTTNGMTATRDVEIVAADITGSVSISGDCVYGETLIVDTSKILPENADLEYKWYINDTNSTTGGTLVKEANSDSGLGNRYFISGDAIDKYVYVEVTASLENYTTKTFTDVVGPVQRADINRVDASLIHDIFVYDGNPKKPEVYVVDLRGPGDLTLGEDYTLEYKDNVNVGTGKVIVKGINKYTGELELTFKIIKAPEFELVNLTPEWTTSNVSIAINILDVGAGIKKVLFENEEVTLQNNTTTVVVDKNGLYTAEVFDIYGNAVVKELYVGNIDREVPVIEEVKYDGVTFAKEVKVEVKATDTGSGVYAYAVSEKDAEPTTWTQITPVENMTIFNFTISSNGTYYLFVKDAVGNITKYNKQIIITNIDNAPPVIKLFNIIDDYTFTTEVFIEINAEDDTGVEGLLLSNEMLTNSQVEDSDNWVPYTETVLYSLPSKDGNHTVYVWVRDSVGKISEYAQDNTLLLNKYVGNNGINNTSFKFLVKDENYNFAKKITESNIKILVKDDSDRVTYSTEYGVNITSISLPVVYGPAQEGTQMMTGEYYTITVENIGGEGTVYLVFDENSVVDKAGNKLANKEIKTDVEVELNTPKITLGTTEIQVSDPDGNLIQAIKVNGKTVLLTSGKMTYEKLKTEYGITLKTDDTIEAFDKHSNSVMVTVQ